MRGPAIDQSSYFNQKFCLFATRQRFIERALSQPIIEHSPNYLDTHFINSNHLFWYKNVDQILINDIHVSENRRHGWIVVIDSGAHCEYSVICTGA